MPRTARRLAAGPCMAAALLVGCTQAENDGPPAAGSQPSLSTSPTGAPALDVEVVADGFDHPWDVAQAPDGTLLLDERPGGFTAVLPDGTVQPVQADLDDLFA